jgi:hypothetical protein
VPQAGKVARYLVDIDVLSARIDSPDRGERGSVFTDHCNAKRFTHEDSRNYWKCTSIAFNSMAIWRQAKGQQPACLDGPPPRSLRGAWTAAQRLLRRRHALDP